MNKKLLLEKYRANLCTAEELTQIESYIASGEIQMDELYDHQELDAFLSDSIEPDKAVDDQIVASIQQGRPLPWKWIGLGIGCLLLGAIIMNIYLTNRTESIDQSTPAPSLHFANELQQSSNSNEKIRLVSSEIPNIESDAKIINALLYSLNHDKSTNVRLACVQTLSEYGHLENVRTGLINAIVNQTSAMVLNNIAEALNSNGTELSKDEFENRINKNLPKPIMKSIEDHFIKI